MDGDSEASTVTAYGVVEWPGAPQPRVVARAGDTVLDLAGTLEGSDLAALVRGPSLDALLAAGPDAWTALRAAVTERPAEHTLPLGEVRPVLPFTVADYVDFYSSEHHARNVGEILRPGQPPLLPNWKHLPVGYHGRAGTVVVSGTDVRRPRGQLDKGARYAPTEKLDIEAEVGFVVGTPSTGPVRPEDWRDHVFGVVLVNDWSARDVQAFEGQPLGPFLAKSFLTSVSPWVVPLAALEGAFVEPAAQDPTPLDHLLPAGPALDLHLEVRLNGHVVSRPRATDLYWTAAQQLAHMTSNGAPLRTGDLYASGTVSGPERDTRGCLLELSWNGAEPIDLPDGTTRTFLLDGDTVEISATAGGVDLGTVAGTVVPA